LFKAVQVHSPKRIPGTKTPVCTFHVPPSEPRPTANFKSITPKNGSKKHNLMFNDKNQYHTPNNR